MAHEITADDGLILVGEPAWHGLGVVVPRDQGLGIREGFRRAIPWDPALIPLYLANQELVPDALGVVARMPDPEKPSRYIGTVSSKYALVTHEHVLELAEAVKVAAPQIELETVGTCAGGRKVFLLLKVGSYGVGLNKADMTSTYLALLNSYDGSTALRGFGTEVRVVCANTYAASLAKADGEAVGFRICHTGALGLRLEAAKKALQAGTLQLAQLEQEAGFLADQPITVAKAGEYFGKVAAILYPALATIRPADEKEAEAWDRQVERARETVSAWVCELEHERQALVSGTYYAALEAVTHWADHQRPRVKETAADRLFGRGAAIKMQAREAALVLAK